MLTRFYSQNFNNSNDSKFLFIAYNLDAIFLFLRCRFDINMVIGAVELNARSRNLHYVLVQERIYHPGLSFWKPKRGEIEALAVSALYPADTDFAIVHWNIAHLFSIKHFRFLKRITWTTKRLINNFSFAKYQQHRRPAFRNTRWLRNPRRENWSYVRLLN